MDFTGARDDGVAVASAGPRANHLHLAPDRQPRQYLSTQFLQAGWPFLPPNQQHQSTERSKTISIMKIKFKNNTVNFSP